jgi:anti-sigma factor (TIGR02949 family)
MSFVREPVDCTLFRELVYAFESDELLEGDRTTLQRHLDLCEECARYLEVERSFTHVLRARLRRAPPPEGLEARVRDSLRRESPVSRFHTRALGGPAFAAMAAAALLAVVLLPLFSRSSDRTSSPRSQGLVPVSRDVTIVDLLCDQQGLPIATQRACTVVGHVNALRLADGTYWGIMIADSSSRRLAYATADRGRRVRIEGNLYPAIQTVRVERIFDLPRTRGNPDGGTEAENLFLGHDPVDVAFSHRLRDVDTLKRGRDSGADSKEHR